MTSTKDPFSAYATLEFGQGRGGLRESIGYYRLEALRSLCTGPGLDRLPFTIRILLESVLRNCDGFAVTEDDVRRLCNWNAAAPAEVELPFVPARVILQDLTGVPVLVDIASMRAAVARAQSKIVMVPVRLVRWVPSQSRLQRSTDATAARW